MSHPDSYAGLPDEWSESARETYVQIEDELGDTATSAQRAALYECCAMLAMADALDESVRSDGVHLEGYRGKRQLNPAIAEARAQRRTALAHLRTFTRPATGSASMSGAALAAARWGTR